MQEFDIKGKVSVTATVKAQVDDSPVALPPPFIKDNQEDVLQKEGQTPSYLNSAILEEFKDVLPELTRNLTRMNEAVNKYNQSSIQNLWSETKFIQNQIPSINTEEQDIIKAEGTIISDKQTAEETSIVKNDSEKTQDVKLSTDALLLFISTLNNNQEALKEFGGFLPELLNDFRILNEIVNKEINSQVQKSPVADADGKQIKREENIIKESSAQNITGENQDIRSILESFNREPKKESIENTTINNNEDFLTQQGTVEQNRENTSDFTEAMQDSVDSIRANTTTYKDLDDVMPEMLKNFRMMNEIVARTNQNLPAVGRVITSEDRKKERKESDIDRGFLQLIQTGGNLVQQGVHGNVAGAANTFLSGTQNMINYGKDIAQIDENEAMLEMLKKLGIGAAIVGTVVGATDAIANKYIEEMPTIYGTGRAFGSTKDTNSMIAFQGVNEYNKGTNLSTENFNEIVQALRKQGVGNGLEVQDQISMAGDIAQTTARWAYATGGSADQYAELAGIMSRYGGSKNVSEDFNYLVTAGKASGLNDTQIPEFLAGIQKVMEDGISKGFERSATDVADTLLMFSKLSGGNAFWQGEQGARLLNQANSGISRATSLSKTEDLIVYSAFNNAYTDEQKEQRLRDKGTYVDNGGYVNTMQLIEQGINSENFSSIMESLNSAYGDNTEAKIEALRNMTGLNYTGAARLFNLDLNETNKDLDTKINDILSSPDNQNKETRYQDAMNKIKEAVVNIGAGAAEIKIALTEKIAKSVDRIADKVAGDYEEKVEEQQITELVETMTPEQQAYLGKNIDKLIFGGMTEEEQKQYLENLSHWNGWGMFEEDNHIFSSEKYTQNALTGENYEQVFKKRIGNKSGDVNEESADEIVDYLKGEYVNEILKWTGRDLEEGQKFVEYAATNTSEEAKIFRQTVYEDSNNDLGLSDKERSVEVEYLKNLYEEFKKITAKLDEPIELQTAQP